MICVECGDDESAEDQEMCTDCLEGRIVDMPASVCNAYAMNTAETVRNYINTHGIVRNVEAYDIPSIVATLEQWAAEDGIPTTAISAEEVSAVVEANRTGIQA